LVSTQVMRAASARSAAWISLRLATKVFHQCIITFLCHKHSCILGGVRDCEQTEQGRA
jgi:hypothetical protein